MNGKALGKRITDSAWQAWMGQWAELIQSGMSVLDALALSSELQTDSRQGALLRKGLLNTSRFLQEGQNLQTAFRASFNVVPSSLEISLLCAQASGDLGSALREQLERWKTTSDAQQTLGKSMVYPLLVMMLAVACWVLLHFISKPHLALERTSGQGAGDWSNWLLGAGLLLLPLALLAKFQQSRNKAKRRPLLPYSAWVSSSFYHVIACELHAGLDLIYCLRHRTVPSQKWLGLFDPSKTAMLTLNRLTLKIQQHLKQGMSLSQAMQHASAPDFLIRQSQLAEQTGNLAHCFFLASKVYEMRARDMQQRLQTVLPPIALAIAAITLALAYQFTLAPLYNNLVGMA